MTDRLTATEASSQPALRQTLVRAVVAIAALGLGIATVHGLETMLNAVFDKPPAPLRKLLPEMSRQLGAPMRYIAEGPDEVLTPEFVETLGTTDYLMRQYRDQSKGAEEPGNFLNFNINYYATGTSTPHVPEICWAGTGREEAPSSRLNFVVKNVPRLDGTRVDLTMKMISFVPLRGATATASGEPLYDNVAYLFHVNGEYVAGPQEVTSRFWKASYQYAYHSKIEITPMISLTQGRSLLTCTQAQAQQIIGDFIREALPEVEACLPDPAILTAKTKVK
jgi:hypothetical protein